MLYLNETHNKIADKYDKVFARREFSNKLSRYRNVLLSYAEGDVLETGVGTGKTFKFYNSKQISSYTGIDWSHNMLEKAFETKQELQKEGKFSLNTTLFKLMQADVHNMPFSDNSFDSVVDSMSLQSYYDLETALNEISRVCKPDGKILVIARGLSYLSLYNSYLKFRAAKDLIETGQVEHLDFSKIIEKHKFKIIH